MGPPPLPTTPGGNSSSSGGGMNGGMPFKPVPPPKPKNYRPPMQNGMNEPHHPGQQPHWDNGMVSMGIVRNLSNLIPDIHFSLSLSVSGTEHCPISAHERIRWGQWWWWW